MKTTTEKPSKYRLKKNRSIVRVIEKSIKRETQLPEGLKGTDDGLRTISVNLAYFTAPLILQNVDPIGYGYDTSGPVETDKEKVAFMAKTFKSEIWKHQERYFRHDIKKGFTSWMQGLCFCHVPFMNYEILELAKGWGVTLTTEEQEDIFIACYWLSLGSAFINLMHTHRINFRTV